MSDQRRDLLDLRRELSDDVGVSLYWGDDEDHVPEVLPLGLDPFDRVLSGGLSFNRVTLIIGEEQAGKTLVAYTAMRAAQARDIPTVFVDVERSWTAEWADRVGLDSKSVLVIEPTTGEQAFEAVKRVVQTEPPGVVVLDSIAAMPPAVELEADASKQFMGTQARMVNRGIRDINALNRGWLVILINQLREKVGVVYGSPVTIPGGKGQRFYAWQIIMVRRGALIREGGKDEGRVVGRMLLIRADKNKQGPPLGEAEIPFYFTGKFDLVAALVDSGIEFGIVEARGGYYSFDGQKWHGRRRVHEAFAESDELREKLVAAIRDVPSLDDL